MLRLFESKEVHCPICLDKVSNRGLSCCWQKICVSCLTAILSGVNPACPFCRKSSDEFYSVIIRTPAEVKELKPSKTVEVKFLWSSKPYLTLPFTAELSVNDLIQKVNEQSQGSFTLYKTLPNARIQYYLRIGDKLLHPGTRIIDYSIMTASGILSIIIGERHLETT